MKQIAKFLFLCVAPLLLAGVALLLICTDLICRLRLLLGMHSGKRDRKGAEDRAFSIPPAGGAQNVSIVIPNWNGKDLLEKYLPTVIAACSEQDEIIVVDNASTDGSAEFIRRNFPRVNVITAERNLGFGGGSNLGIQSAQNRIVVLLNNDMRVEPGFLRPLLEGFTDDRTFAVTTQIFFSDSSRRREETGLTSGCFEKGFLRVRHEIDGSIQTLYPTFYAGGGSTAYDRDKFRELGGFDSLF